MVMASKDVAYTVSKRRHIADSENDTIRVRLYDVLMCFLSYCLSFWSYLVEAMITRPILPS